MSRGRPRGPSRPQAQTRSTTNPVSPQGSGTRDIQPVQASRTAGASSFLHRPVPPGESKVVLAKHTSLPRSRKSYSQPQRQQNSSLFPGSPIPPSALASPGGKEPAKPASHPPQKPRATNPASPPLRASLSPFSTQPIRWVGAEPRGHKEELKPVGMGGGRSGAREADGEWEVRPGGMLVQRREGEEGPTIRLRVSHGPALREVIVPAQATFGELKRVLAQVTGLEPERQRLCFRGREKCDDEFLHSSGAKDGAKVLLLEKHVPANVEQKAEPVMMDENMMRACEAVVRVRSEVDKLAAKVCDLEKSVLAGRKVEDKEFVVLTELLMVQLLKLDGIEAEGEARAQRKAEVRRIQNLVEILDKLKARNANPFSDSSKSASVSTEWETFDNGVGSLNAPPARFSSTQNDTDWEQFD